MPREYEVVPLAQATLAPPNGSTAVGPLRPRRLNVLELQLPRGYDVVLEAPPGVNTTFQATVSVDGAVARNWGGGILVGSSCDEDRLFAVLFTTSRVEGVEKVALPYRMTENDDCEDPEADFGMCQVADPIPTCLVGSWRMVDESVSEMLGTNNTATGNIVTVFFEGGGFIHSFEELTLHQVTDEWEGDLPIQRPSPRLRRTGASLEATRRCRPAQHRRPARRCRPVHLQSIQGTLTQRDHRDWTSALPVAPRPGVLQMRRQQHVSRHAGIPEDRRIAVHHRGHAGHPLAGTDTPNPFVFPGFSAHDDLMLLVEGERLFVFGLAMWPVGPLADAMPP